MADLLNACPVSDIRKCFKRDEQARDDSAHGSLDIHQIERGDADDNERRGGVGDAVPPDGFRDLNDVNEPE